MVQCSWFPLPKIIELLQHIKYTRWEKLWVLYSEYYSIKNVLSVLQTREGFNSCTQKL